MTKKKFIVMLTQISRMTGYTKIYYPPLVNPFCFSDALWRIRRRQMPYCVATRKMNSSCDFTIKVMFIFEFGYSKK